MNVGAGSMFGPPSANKTMIPNLNNNGGGSTLS